MVLARFVLLAAVLSAASSVSAAVTIDLGPSDWRNLGPNGAHTSGGIRSSFGQTTRIPPTMNTLNVTRNPVVPYGSIGNGLKNIARATPQAILASAGMAALFAAMDWVFDQGEWKKEDLMDEEDPYGYYYGVPFSQGLYESNAHDACMRSLEFRPEGWDVTGYTVGFPTLHCHYMRPNGTPTTYSAGIIGGGCSEGFVYVNNPPYTGCYKYGLVPLTDSDFDELTGKLPTLPAGDVAGAAGDAQRQLGNPLPGYHDTQMSGPSSISGPETTTTSTDPVTGDTVVTNTQTTTNISYGDTTITTSNTTVTNTYTNGNLTNTETITETPGELPVTDPSSGGTAGEWPGFCDWASVVCNFIDWFQEPFDAPEVEWPLIEDQDYQEEYDFTLAASCPEPYTIELALFPPVQFNWQPFCDLATFIKPLVLASAAIFAAFISLGIARART